VDSGNRIRLAGQGETGPGGGPAGDLYAEVKVRPRPGFTRQGDDLHCQLRIPMTAAALGCTVTVETLDGPQEVTVRPGTQPGAVIVLDGLGVTHLRSRGRGDLKIDLDVRVPTVLDEPQRALLEQLAAMRGEERPQAELAGADNSFFGWVKDKLHGK
jgi:molecular chaperone DnaJ